MLGGHVTGRGRAEEGGAEQGLVEEEDGMPWSGGGGTISVPQGTTSLTGETLLLSSRSPQPSAASSSPGPWGPPGVMEKVIEKY